MATTIQISKELLQKLKERKMYEKESYEEVIWELIEDTQELDEKTKEEITLARKQIERGETTPWEEVKRKAGL